MVCGLFVVVVFCLSFLYVCRCVLSIVCYALRFDCGLLLVSCDAFGVVLGAACCLLCMCR